MLNLGSRPFAVVDVETTGIYANQYDRVLEVAVVRLRPDGSIEDEYVTLVNPGRDVGPTDVHRITASEVVHAPTFAEIAGDVAERLDGVALAGHNVRFDINFLRSEYARLGIRLPHLPAVCTLDLGWNLLDGAPGRRLCDCCEAAGVPVDEFHSALGDARATAELLQILITRAIERGVAIRSVVDPFETPGRGWGGPASGKRVQRSDARAAAKAQRTFLSKLVAGLPGVEATTADRAAYMDVLDRALEDRRVVMSEALGLIAIAAEWGLSKQDVLETHRAYLEALAREARADGRITDAELQDLVCVAQLLGVPERDLFEMLEQATMRSKQTAEPATSNLRGRSVCFTGTLLAEIDGERITRNRAEELAAHAGLEVHPRVSKKLDILVVADPNTLSRKAKAAAEYGTRIIAERAFWRALGLEVT